MKQKNKKEKWGTPKLIVLIRGKSEEAVLSGCKLTSSSGPSNGVYACRAQEHCTSVGCICTGCFELSAS